MKLVPLFCVLVALAGCQSTEEKTSSCKASETCLFEVAELTMEEAGPVPTEALTFETQLSLTNFNSSQKEKVALAADVIKLVVASEEFRDAILNHTYKGQKTFVDNGGLTNLQIYQRFLLGAEKLSPSQNNTLDADLELYHDTSRTVGYTTPSTQRIWMNTKFFNDYTPAQVAGNLTHEWMHKLGFGHPTTHNPSRPYTVPYAFGYLMSKLAAQYL